MDKLKDENIKHIVNDCSMCAIITDHVRYDEVKEISSDLKIIGCEDIKNVTEKKYVKKPPSEIGTISCLPSLNNSENFPCVNNMIDSITI